MPGQSHTGDADPGTVGSPRTVRRPHGSHRPLPSTTAMRAMRRGRPPAGDLSSESVGSGAGGRWRD